MGETSQLYKTNIWRSMSCLELAENEPNFDFQITLAAHLFCSWASEVNSNRQFLKSLGLLSSSGEKDTVTRRWLWLTSSSSGGWPWRPGLCSGGLHDHLWPFPCWTFYVRNYIGLCIYEGGFVSCFMYFEDFFVFIISMTYYYFCLEILFKHEF